MNCLECIELLQRRLDGELVSSTSLEEHLAQCAVCREQFALAQQLVGGVKAFTWPTPSGTLTERIISGVLEDRRMRRTKLERRLWITMALAASILLFAAGSYLWMPGKKNDVAIKKPESMDKAIDAWANDIVNRARDNAQKLLSVASPPKLGLTLPDLTKLDEPLEPTAQALRQSGRELGDGLQIVAQTTRQALDFFIRELPATRMTN
jgi:hypothetical protein